MYIFFPQDRQKSRYLEYLIKHSEGKPFRTFLQNSSVRLQELCLGRAQQPLQTTATGQPAQPVQLSAVDKSELRYQSIRITALLMKQDDQWLATQQALVNTYQKIWCCDDYLVITCFVFLYALHSSDSTMLALKETNLL